MSGMLPVYNAQEYFELFRRLGQRESLPSQSRLPASRGIARLDDAGGEGLSGLDVCASLCISAGVRSAPS